MKFDKNIYVSHGAHLAKGISISALRGALLHFKYFSDFVDNVPGEIERNVRWNNSSEYRKYGDTLKEASALFLHHSGSERFSGSEQLIELGVMRESAEFQTYRREVANMRQRAERTYLAKLDPSGRVRGRHINDLMPLTCSNT